MGMSDDKCINNDEHLYLVNLKICSIARLLTCMHLSLGSIHSILPYGHQC